MQHPTISSSSTARLSVAAVLAVVLLPGVRAARADCTPVKTAQLAAQDGLVGDNYGSAIAIDGDTLLIGAPWDDSDAGADSGSVYVYRRAADGVWSFSAKWTASDAAAGDQFGRALALSGDVALVAAPLDDLTGAANAGSVYVFTRTGDDWSETAKLTASDAALGDQFGWSVALSGNTALIGAAWDDRPSGANAGSAYVFKFDNGTWTQQAQLLAATPVGGDFFGWSVALAGDTALIGAFQSDVAGQDAGAVYVFTETAGTWSPTQVLTASDPNGGDSFGYSIAVWGDRAAISAWSDDERAVNAGAVYVFARGGGTWFQEIKLTAEDGAASDSLGTTVALFDEVIVAGARGADLPGKSNVGAAYVFVVSGSTWDQAAKITLADATAGDALSVCTLYEDTAVIGAPGRGSNTGISLVYHAPCQCVNCDTNCDGSVNGIDIQLFRDALEHNVSNMCSPCMGDSNRDGTINGFDIAGFVECLTRP